MNLYKISTFKAKEINNQKEVIVIVNKADFLTDRQRGGYEFIFYKNY